MKKLEFEVLVQTCWKSKCSAQLLHKQMSIQRQRVQQSHQSLNFYSTRPKRQSCQFQIKTLFPYSMLTVSVFTFSSLCLIWDHLWYHRKQKTSSIVVCVTRHLYLKSLFIESILRVPLCRFLSSNVIVMLHLESSDTVNFLTPLGMLENEKQMRSIQISHVTPIASNIFNLRASTCKKDAVDNKFLNPASSLLL